MPCRRVDCAALCVPALDRSLASPKSDTTAVQLLFNRTLLDVKSLYSERRPNLETVPRSDMLAVL